MRWTWHVIMLAGVVSKINNQCGEFMIFKVGKFKCKQFQWKKHWNLIL